jgi:hypothetical protein
MGDRPDDKYMPGAVRTCSLILRPGSAKDVEYRIPKDFVSLSHAMLFHRINALKNLKHMQRKHLDMSWCVPNANAESPVCLLR